MPEHHGNWKGDDAQPATGRWRARRWFPMRPGQVCAECEVRPAVERHHWDGNPLNNTANVVFLCRRCHLRIDGRLAWLTRPVKPRATHCQRGHELTPENVTLYRGKRRCRLCYNARMRAYKAKRRST